MLEYCKCFLVLGYVKLKFFTFIKRILKFDENLLINIEVIQEIPFGPVRLTSHLSFIDFNKQNNFDNWFITGCIHLHPFLHTHTRE